MSRNLLSDNEIKRTKPPEKETFLNDGDGLSLRVRPKGEKDWFFRYKVEGKTKKIALGRYPGKTLAAARIDADRLRLMRSEGAETAGRRTPVTLSPSGSAMTMDDLFKAWSESYGVHLDIHWMSICKSHWNCHLSPLIGTQAISFCDKQPILFHYDEMVNSGKRLTAHRVLSLLKQVMTWGAERCHVADDHPLVRIIIPKRQNDLAAGQQQLFDIQEYLNTKGEESIGGELEDQATGRALQFSELIQLLNKKLPTSTQATTGIHMMRFMLAAGIRSSEATRIRWQWIDLDRKLMILPAGSMKKRKMHHVHLSAYAVRQLEAMAKLRTGDFVFQAPKKDNDHITRANVGNDIASRQFYRSTSEADEAYEARLGKRMQSRRSRKEFDLYNLTGGKWTLYDLRRTAATRLEELGVDRDMVGRVLAHSRTDTRTTGRYARHTQWEQRSRALDLLGEALASCEAGVLPMIQAQASQLLIPSAANHPGWATLNNIRAIRLQAKPEVASFNIGNNWNSRPSCIGFSVPVMPSLFGDSVMSSERWQQHSYRRAVRGR